MPIKLNGTTFNNGGTAKFNGTTLSKIVFNTTTVWEAIKTFYPGATVYNLTANSGTYNTSTFLTQVSSGQNQNSTTLYIQVDLTGISSIKITGTFQVSTVRGYAGVWISTPTQFNNYKDNQLRYPYYDVGPGASSTYYVQMQRINNTTGTVSTYTIDTSSLTGTHYLCIGCYSNASTGGTLKAQITSVVEA